MATSAPPNRIRVAGGQQDQVVDATAPTDPPNLTLPLIFRGAGLRAGRLSDAASRGLLRA
jgi:hypothetical protein